MTITEEIKIKIANANKENPYVDITPYELGIAFPFVNYIGFHPDVDEILIYATPAADHISKGAVSRPFIYSANLPYKYAISRHFQMSPSEKSSRVIRHLQFIPSVDGVFIRAHSSYPR